MKRLVLICGLLVLLPVQAYAQATIGTDNVFNIQPITFLTTGTPEADVFNYFFTLEIFCGMIALFIRVCLRVMRL